MALVLGAAFGATTTHVEVRDADTGSLLTSGRASHAEHGTAADDPTAWWRSLASAIASGGEREIAAMSVCGSHPGAVLLDGAGAVLRPLQPWAGADAAAEATRLRRALGAERWARRTGALPGTTTLITRLAWLQRADPTTFGRIGAALLPHDWLTYRLAGRAVTDRGSASLTGAWSPSSEAWFGEVLERLAPGRSEAWWAARLPAVLGPSEQADWLDAPVYELLGLRGRPLVGPGTGEPMAVALALGLTPGRAAISLGPSSAVLGGLATAVADPTGAVRSRADATGHHLAVAIAPGGAALIDAVRGIVGEAAGSLGELALDHADRPPPQLVVVPGRTPDGAVVAGLRPGVTSADLARAAFDGVACAALDALDRVREVGGGWDEDAPLRLVARAEDLAAHARTLADLAGRPVQPVAARSLAAAGACVQAAAVLRQAPPDEVAAAWDLARGEPVEPQATEDWAAERRTAHAEAQARYEGR